MASQHNSYDLQEKTRDQLRPEFQEFLDLSMVSGQVDNILCLLAFHVNCLAGFLNRQHRQQYPRSKTCMHLCWLLFIDQKHLICPWCKLTKTHREVLVKSDLFQGQTTSSKNIYPPEILTKIIIKTTQINRDVIFCLAGAPPSPGDSYPKNTRFWVWVTEILTNMWGPYPYHTCKVGSLYPHLPYFYDNCR